MGGPHIEELWPIEVKSFYRLHYFNKTGEGAGGKFDGQSINTILKNLNVLKETLPEKAVDFIKYLQCITNLHIICIQEKLPSDYKETLQKFKDSYNRLYEN